MPGEEIIGNFSAGLSDCQCIYARSQSALRWQRRCGERFCYLERGLTPRWRADAPKNGAPLNANVSRQHLDMSLIRSLWILEPITVTFCALSLVVLVLAYSVPGSTAFIFLSPTLTLEKGYVWQLLTYALLPYSILSF